MEKLDTEELITYIADLFHFVPNTVEGLPLDETPLHQAFEKDGDKGESIARDPDLLKLYEHSKVEEPLIDLVRSAFIEHANTNEINEH